MAKRLSFFLVALALGCLTCLPRAASASDLLVPSQYPTIAAALGASSSGDHIVLACGTYHERLLNLRSGVTIRSESVDPNCVVIDGDGLGGVFLGSSATQVVIDGITIRNGSAVRGGAMNLAFSEVVVRRCRLYDNVSRFDGSAIYCYWSYLRIEDTVIAYNRATGSLSTGACGAVSMRSARGAFVRSTIVHNTHLPAVPALNVGGVFFQLSNASAFERTIVALNTGVQVGGGTGHTSDCCYFQDPLFCDAAGRDFRLHSASACMPSAECLGVIGALGLGCGPIANVSCTVATSPPGLTVRVDGVETTSPATFLWPQFSEHTIEALDPPTIGQSRRIFRSWSDAGARAHVVNALRLGQTWTATYDLQHYVTVQASPAGSATPASNWFLAGSSITLNAVPNPRDIFIGWEGTGAGSYTGPANPVNIQVQGPITQTVRTDPISYSFSVSASDTDPFANTAPAAPGGRILYLWLTCARTGLSALETYATGTVSVLAFEPLNGVLNIGTAQRLLLAVPGCPTGDTVNFLMGRWFVMETAAGGTLCLGGSGGDDYELVPTGAVDCQTVRPFLVRFPGVTGFNSTGGAPCVKGQQGCGGVTPAPATVTAASEISLVAGIPWSLSSSPNPFEGTATVRFSLPSERHVKLSIYDVTGRLVRRLSHERLAAGRHELSWDGRDSGNSIVPSGVYFVRLDAGDRTLNHKMLRLVK